MGQRCGVVLGSTGGLFLWTTAAAALAGACACPPRRWQSYLLHCQDVTCNRAWHAPRAARRPLHTRMPTRRPLHTRLPTRRPLPSRLPTRRPLLAAHTEAAAHTAAHTEAAAGCPHGGRCPHTRAPLHQPTHRVRRVHHALRQVYRPPDGQAHVHQGAGHGTGLGHVAVQGHLRTRACARGVCVCVCV